MRFNELGTTGIKASVIGLGTWPFGGGYDWGTVDETELLNTVSAALDQGINLIDTAPIYGDGSSETLLGRALTGRRSHVVLAGKCGLVKKGSWTDHDLRPETIRRQLTESLSRLKTDYLDLYLIHYPDPLIPLEQAALTLLRLQEEGKIRAIGLCNVSGGEIARVAQMVPLACVQNEYSYLRPQAGRRVAEISRQYHISLMGYGTLAGGLLSGKYKREPNFRRADARNYFYKDARGDGFVQADYLARQLAQVAQKYNKTPAIVAGAWALNQANFVLCGAKQPAQIVENAQAADLILSPEDLIFLEKRRERN